MFKHHYNYYMHSCQLKHYNKTIFFNSTFNRMRRPDQEDAEDGAFGQALHQAGLQSQVDEEGRTGSRVLQAGCRMRQGVICESIEPVF